MYKVKCLREFHGISKFNRCHKLFPIHFNPWYDWTIMNLLTISNSKFFEIHVQIYLILILETIAEFTDFWNSAQDFAPLLHTHLFIHFIPAAVGNMMYELLSFISLPLLSLHFTRSLLDSWHDIFFSDAVSYLKKQEVGNLLLWPSQCLRCFLLSWILILLRAGEGLWNCGIRINTFSSSCSSWGSRRGKFRGNPRLRPSRSNVIPFSPLHPHTQPSWFINRKKYSADLFLAIIRLKSM